jgi:hypothetical protein
VGVVGVAEPVVKIKRRSFAAIPAGTVTVGFAPVTLVPAATNDIDII